MQNSERHNDYTISTRRPKKAENAFSAGVQHEASSEGSRPTTPTSDQESHGAAKRQSKTKNKSGQDVPKKAERTVSERTQRRRDINRENARKSRIRKREKQEQLQAQNDQLQRENARLTQALVSVLQRMPSQKLQETGVPNPQHVTEETIQEWVNEGGMPVYRHFKQQETPDEHAAQASAFSGQKRSKPGASRVTIHKNLDPQSVRSSSYSGASRSSGQFQEDEDASRSNNGSDSGQQRADSSMGKDSPGAFYRDNDILEVDSPVKRRKGGVDYVPDKPLSEDKMTSESDDLLPSLAPGESFPMLHCSNLWDVQTSLKPEEEPRKHQLGNVGLEDEEEKEDSVPFMSPWS